MGPTGLASECRGGGGKLHVGASAGAMDTTLVFGGALVPLAEQTAGVSASWQLSRDVTLTGGGGALLGGALGADALSPGWMGFAGVSWHVLAGAGARPFVTVAGTVSALGAHAGGDALTSLDAKLTGTAAWPLAGRFAPYVGAALFGGPVFHGASTGTDLRHFQVLGGIALALPAGFDAFVEVSPVAERAVSAGVGWSY